MIARSPAITGGDDAAALDGLSNHLLSLGSPHRASRPMRGLGLPALGHGPSGTSACQGGGFASSRSRGLLLGLIQTTIVPGTERIRAVRAHLQMKKTAPALTDPSESVAAGA